MSGWQLYATSGFGLIVVGFAGLITGSDHLRRILATNIMATGVFVVLVALARRGPAAIPDPVPQALVLTGIVVAVSATALALAIARRLAPSGNGDDPERPYPPDSGT